ncbi:MAG TPA: hypothetical protein VEJ23_07875 [Solirubrobacteraceae bacterium]|nr:hypothetical protein [Solirubrobacteraceae bacterium]
MTPDDPAPSASAGGRPPAPPGDPPTPAGGARERPAAREHRWLVRLLVWGTTVLAIVAIFAVWSNRQLLNPNNWANTSTKLLQNQKVREATSNYLVNQLYANVNVSEELKKRLPTQLQPLAAPVAGALQNLAIQAAERALANARVQEAWKHANKAADETFLAIVNGKGAVATNGGVVTLDLASIVSNITERLGLPNVSSKLPASVAHVTILKSKQLKAVQDGVKALKGLALLLTIIVPLLYALAIFLARARRRETLMQVGIAIVFAGLVVFAGRAIIESQAVDSLVKVEANKPAGEAIISIATSMLSEIAGAFVIVGVPLIAAAWFAGPARLAVRARREIAPFLRDQPGWTYGIVIAIMLLIFIWDPIPATGKPAGIIVFLALALFGTEVLRRQTAREFPDARARTAQTPASGAPA